MNTQQQIIDSFRRQVSETIKRLIENRHLYQSEEVDISDLTRLVNDFEMSEEAQQIQIILQRPNIGGIHAPMPSLADQKQKLECTLDRLLTLPWRFFIPTMLKRRRIVDPTGEDWCFFELPSVLATCDHCNNIRPAHNPGLPGDPSDPHIIELLPGTPTIQVFVFPYQCQSCRGEPIVFLVRRNGLKITLVGRSRFEKVHVPKALPKEEKDLFSEATIAFDSGRTLAALFFLRSFIEQYMRRTCGTTERIPGEDLADQYNALLDETFPSQFRSFRTNYSTLSDCLHRAHGAADVFLAQRDAIIKHFEMLQLIPIAKKKI